MKKFAIIFSIFLNFILSTISLDLYVTKTNLKGLVDNYCVNYLPKEMYYKARDKVSDYEWCLRNIYKCENPDLMRHYWNKR